MSPIKPAIVPSGSGRIVRAFGDEAMFHLEGLHTGGRYTLFTNITVPAGGPPLHLHENEDEWWLVLEGKASFWIDGHWREVLPGGSVFAPRNSIHTFKNTGDTPLKQLIQTSPSGFETFFSRCGEVFSKPGPPDMALVVAISAEHGIKYIDP